MMKKISDRVLAQLATSAEEAFWEALGLASRMGTYEPKMSKDMSTYKKQRTSKMERVVKKLAI